MAVVKLSSPKTRTREWRVRNPDWTHGHWLRILEFEIKEGRVYVPVKGPLDGDEENGSLESVLYDNTGPVISDPTFTNSFCEGNTESRTSDKDSVTDSKSHGISGQEGGKLQVQRRPMRFPAGNVRPDHENEDGYPEERKKALCLD